jgi:hypothetical protein
VNQSQTGSSSSTSAYSFYYDTQSGNPTVSSFSISLNTTNVRQVSGIWILYGSTKLNATTSCTNIGTYFYNNSQILSYSTGQNEPNLTNITSGKNATSLNNSITITNTGNPAITYSNGSFAKIISVTSTAYNCLGNSVTSTESTISAILDQSSFDLLNNTSKTPTGIQLVGVNHNYNPGFRLSSGISSGNTPAYTTPITQTSASTIPYDHTLDITSLEELQIFNGTYGTKMNTNGYLNYSPYYKSNGVRNTLNYSGISSSGYRFATFVWKANTSLSPYTKVSFQMYGVTQSVSDPNGTPSVSGSPILFYYRLEDANNISAFNTTYINSKWIDANGVINQISGTNYFNSASLLGGKNTDSLYSNSFSSNTLTVNALTPNITVSASDNKYIYLRIGLPMNIDIGFQYVSMKLTL